MVLPSLVFFIYVGEMRVIVSIYVKREGIIVGPPPIPLDRIGSHPPRLANPM